MAVSRFGVSVEKELLDALDNYVKENFFTNRSQAIRHLLEKYLVEEKWKCDNEVAGAVTLVYAHNRKEIRYKIADIVKEFNPFVLSVQQFYLNETNSMDIIAIKGPSYKLTELSDKLVGIKHLQHGKLIMSKAE